MIKGILFDLDDTLTKTSITKFAALQHTGKKYYNMDLSYEQIKKYWGLPFTVFMKKLFKEVEEIEKVIQKYYIVRKLFPNIAYEDTLATVNKLKKKLSLGIVSAANKRLVYEDLTITGMKISDFFYIQTEDDTKIHKPDPRVFDPILKIFKSKNIEKHELFFVGDHLYDYQAAKGAGLDFYGVADRTTPKEAFKKAGAKTINSLKDLLKMMD